MIKEECKKTMRDEQRMGRKGTSAENKIKQTNQKIYIINNTRKKEGITWILLPESCVSND